MVFPIPSTAPPWYSTPTAIVSLPTAAPNSNSLIKSPTDTPATENRKRNKIKNNNNDRPDDDDDDDVDCFPRQDKQPVQPQDISPTAPTANNTSPSLIESFPDKSTDSTDTDNNNNHNNNIRRATPARTKQSAYRGFGPKPIHVWNGESYQKATSPAHAQLIRNYRQILQFSSPDEDDDADADTTDHNNNNNGERPNDDTIIHDNRYYDDCDDDDEDSDNNTYDDAFNSLDEFDNYTQDDDDDDDDDDDSYTYCSSDDDDYYDNAPNVLFDMHGNQFTIDKMVPYDDKPMTLQAAQRQINAILAGCTTTSSIKEFTNQAKRKQDEFFLPKKKTAHASAAQSPHAPTYVNDNHDAFLYHRWNNTDKNKTNDTKPSTTPRITTPTYHTAPAPIKIPVKDDPSTTPTLETLSTLDTRSSHRTDIDTDTIISITIWNHPIVKYRVPIRTNNRNRSRNPSIAVQHAMIGVYDRLLHPQKLPCLLYLFTRIICVVLSCFILLADSFTMVKIDDLYPDEWND